MAGPLDQQPQTPMTGSGRRTLQQPQAQPNVLELSPEDYIVPATNDQLATESQQRHPIERLRRSVPQPGGVRSLF